MTKSNLPNMSTSTTNYTSEMVYYDTLYSTKPRSSNGDVTFISSSSNITYMTNTGATGTYYASGLYVNQGQEGMLLVLQYYLTDYMLFATDINTITTNITTIVGSGAVAEKTDLTTFNLHANNTALHNGGLYYAYNNIGGAL